MYDIFLRNFNVKLADLCDTLCAYNVFSIFVASNILNKYAWFKDYISEDLFVLIWLNKTILQSIEYILK